MKMVVELIRDSQSQLLQQFQDHNVTANETIFARASHLTMDSTLHVEDGKEVFFAFRMEFVDRADRLLWDDPTRCQQMFFCVDGRAKQILQSLRLNAHGEEKETFPKCFDKMLALMDELFRASGLTYGFNWRKSSKQLDKEFFQDFYTRARADRARFWQVHKKYASAQILPPRMYLAPYVTATNPQQIEFDDSDKARLQKLIDTLASTAPEETTRRFIQHAIIFPTLLANAMPQIRQQIYDDLRTSVWKQFLILDDWTHMCWLMVDSIHNPKLKEEAYKHRDKWYNKPELGTPEGSRIMTKYFFHLLKTAERHHNKKTYLSIEPASAKEKKPKAGTTDNNAPPTGPADVQNVNNKGNKKNNKGNGGKAKVGEVDGETNSPETNGNQPAQQAANDAHPP